MPNCTVFCNIQLNINMIFLFYIYIEIWTVNIRRKTNIVVCKLEVEELTMNEASSCLRKLGHQCKTTCCIVEAGML